jgi:hypothetical protein
VAGFLFAEFGEIASRRSVFIFSVEPQHGSLQSLLLSLERCMLDVSSKSCLIERETKMKALLVMALSLIVACVAVTFLPLSAMAIQVLAVMLGANAVMALVFALMAVDN